MAKINYGFEKRQRELAKQKKQEAKEARKREARAAKASTTPDPAAPDPAQVQDRTADTDAQAPRVHLRTTRED